MNGVSYTHLPRRLILLLACGSALIALLLLLRVSFFLSVVQGESMLPNLRPGDVMLVDKHAYSSITPSRGDIVIAPYHDGLIVKRIVGLPGEELEVKAGTLYVDGDPIAESHGIRKGLMTVEKGKLLAGSFATLGDNRMLLQTVHPILQKNQIVGKVVYVLRLWPYGQSACYAPPTQGAIASIVAIFTGRVKSPEFYELMVNEWQPDLCLMATFGQTIPNHIITLPRLGFFNFHHGDATWPSFPVPDPIAAMVRDGRKEFVLTMHNSTDVIDDGEFVARSHPVAIPSGVMRLIGNASHGQSCTHLSEQS